ncbi:SDR family oxidoreductase [Mameliella sediminis]|uniref:SDR family oxidoreductase n=1 Tax=Mameliella sediminis TaxID=2836866 RepID=UPI001C4646F1|nr:SDR family oxidoreductase [Mameliella sediminis]MBY6116441.1 SDR family oxidoreductase [Antarctobacter heliothermus]MBY6145533.1 SDR family oxidoreductase [Mameliella alba]MBV7393743.1 SDR family oxidoreductase [Mameliella sediminis]MBY6160857.1 SDR family oxidoreductase [Mameliella alba]MBY6169327.1 SDR family oxidoreductase [Mameliella alba]
MNGVLIVTGASAGIGAATARMAAFSGWQRIVVHYGKDKDGAETTAAMVESMGAQAYLVQADVAKPKAIEKMFAKLRDLKPGPVGLVNNAGIVSPHGSIADLTPDRVEKVFSVNVFGAIEVARQSVMLMREWNQGGSIVNVSSAAARLGSANQYVDYAATKGAIDTFTVGLADELAPEGIRVNGIRPGLIETDIHAKGGEPDRLDRLAPSTPMGRAGTAEECAEAILWLLSERASYVTRSILDVAGGR